MSRALIIAAREVRERSFVLLFAILTAILPFIIAMLPRAAAWGRVNTIAIAGLILSVAVAFALSLIVGGSFVGRELSEKRLSFYFARPVGAVALWFGKLTGAIALVTLAFAIVYTPSALVGHSAWGKSWNFSRFEGAGVILATSIGLILISHTLSTMFRSRSAVLALDVVLFAAVGFAAWFLIEPFLVANAMVIAGRIIWGVVAALLVALVGAGAWQLSRGRADLRRSHTEMSRFLWAAMAVGLSMVAAYGFWVRSVEPSDLIDQFAEVNATGDWAVVSGNARYRGDYHPIFVTNVKTGESASFPVAGWAGSEFTRNGKAVTAVAPALRGKGADFMLWMQRLGVDERPHPTGITMTPGSNVVVSDDLTRVAVLNHRSLTVHAFDGPQMLASVRLEAPVPSMRRDAFFVTPGLLRLYTVRNESRGAIDGPQTLTIEELDVPSRRLVKTGEWTTTARWLRFEVSDDGSAVSAFAFRSAAPAVAMILDGRTAQERGRFEGVFGSEVARRLRDGRYVAVRGGQVHVYGQGGELQRSFAAPVGGWARWAGEAAPGVVVYVVRRKDVPSGSTGLGWDLKVIDTSNGTVVREVPNATLAFNGPWGDPRVRASTRSTYLYTDAGGKLWRWNALTGEKTKMF